MGIATVVNYNFALSLFQEGSVPSIYVSVENEREGKQYLNSAPVSPKELSSKITEVKCIPEFLIPMPHSLGSHLKKLELRRINGFYIDLAGFSSVDDYMAAELGSKRRSLKRQLRRLESCFDISYKAYFGHIEKEQYDALFDKMLQFLESRFDQRGDVFDPTINLDVMRKRCYPMILEKRASLHVIYNQSDPIDICVNYHFQDVMSSAISSYDIDYSKFGLGNLDIVKQLEWCFDNDHRIFDLMWGEMPYKYSWCNKVYQYAHHIFYNPRSLAHRLLVPLRIFAYKAKDYLKSKKIKEFKAKIGFGPKKK